MNETLIIVRGLHFAATILAAGTVFFMVLVAEPMFARARLGTKDHAALAREWSWLTWIALAASAVSGTVWLVLVASDIYGASVIEVCIQGGVWTVVTDTRFGLVATLRLGLAAALALAMLWSPHGRDPQRFPNVVRLLLAALFLASLAGVGHAGSASGHGAHLHFNSDIVHLLAAGIWLGGLMPFTMLLARSCRAHGRHWRGIAGASARRFSGLALASVCALALTGTINTWHSLEEPIELFTTNYGRLVLLKVGLFAAMLCIAAVNRLHLTPRLARRGAMQALVRNSLSEVVLAACIMLLVGALGTLPPSGHSHAHGPATEIPGEAAFVHIHTSEVMADVTIVPGRAGAARATIRLLREDFTYYPARSVSLTLIAPSRQGHAYGTRHDADDSWQADEIDLPEGGAWVVNVIITTGTRTTLILDAPVIIGH